jgi:hypothetical protein
MSSSNIPIGQAIAGNILVQSPSQVSADAVVEQIMMKHAGIAKADAVYEMVMLRSTSGSSSSQSQYTTWWTS